MLLIIPTQEMRKIEVIMFNLVVTVIVSLLAHYISRQAGRSTHLKELAHNILYLVMNQMLPDLLQKSVVVHTLTEF